MHVVTIFKLLMWIHYGGDVSMCIHVCTYVHAGHYSECTHNYIMVIVMLSYMYAWSPLLVTLTIHYNYNYSSYLHNYTDKTAVLF